MVPAATLVGLALVAAFVIVRRKPSGGGGFGPVLEAMPTVVAPAPDADSTPVVAEPDSPSESAASPVADLVSRADVVPVVFPDLLARVEADAVVFPEPDPAGTRAAIVLPGAREDAGEEPREAAS